MRMGSRVLIWALMLQLECVESDPNSVGFVCLPDDGNGNWLQLYSIQIHLFSLFLAW